MSVFEDSAFTRSLMQGFSLVDRMAADRRREAQLAELLKLRQDEAEFSRRMRTNQERRAVAGERRAETIHGQNIANYERGVAEYNRQKGDRERKIEAEQLLSNLLSGDVLTPGQQDRLEELSPYSSIVSQYFTGLPAEQRAVAAEQRHVEAAERERQRYERETDDYETRITDLARAREGGELLARIYAGHTLTEPELQRLRESAQVNPQVAEYLRKEYEDQQTIAAYRALQDLATPSPSDPDTSGRGLGDLLSDVQQSIAATELPSNVGAVQDPRDVNLQELAMTDLRAVEDVRRQQEAFDEPSPPTAGVEGAPIGGNPARNKLKREQAVASSNREIVNDQWRSFSTGEDPTGDNLRALDHKLQTAKYFADRNSLDEEVRNASDPLMAPPVEKALEEYWSILTSPDVDRNSREYNNTKRKFSQAFRLAEQMSLQFNIAAQAGIDNRGFPVGNEELAVRFETVSADAPGLPTALSPTRSRAAINAVKRIDAGDYRRLSPAQLNHIHRLKKAGLIDGNDVQSLLMTGHLPRPVGEYKQFEPGPLFYAPPNDGPPILVGNIPDPDAKTPSIRNKLTDDGKEAVDEIFSLLDTPYDTNRSGREKVEFYDTLGQIEAEARENGYDYSNALDISNLAMRFLQLRAIKPLYNKEWRADGEINPDFDTNYGSIAQAMLDPRIDKFWRTELSSLERINNPLTPAKSSNRLDAARRALAASDDPGDRALANAPDEVLERAISIAAGQ